MLAEKTFFDGTQGAGTDISVNDSQSREGKARSGESIRRRRGWDRAEEFALRRDYGHAPLKIGSPVPLHPEGTEHSAAGIGMSMVGNRSTSSLQSVIIYHISYDKKIAEIRIAPIAPLHP
jgi:hypothetical protein